MNNQQDEQYVISRIGKDQRKFYYTERGNFSKRIKVALRYSEPILHIARHMDNYPDRYKGCTIEPASLLNQQKQ